MGNCIMGTFVIGVLVFTLSILMSLTQFWGFVWSFHDWAILYSLLYITRYTIFRWIIPRYVVTDEGAVLQRRIWALLFPTLMLLNFIVGATSGALRSIVLMPFLLVRFFRVDITFLPDGLEDWDWSFHPFLSLVMHAHARLNPVMWAFTSELCKGAYQESFATTAMGRDESLSPPVTGGSRDVVLSTQPFMVEEGTCLREVTARSIVSEAPDRRPSPRQRALGRWYLAVMLARNPSLTAYRTHASKAADGAPAQPSASPEAPLENRRASRGPSNRARMAEFVRATTGGDPQVVRVDR